MKHFSTYLLTGIIVLTTLSCKTQYELKCTTYAQVNKIDTLIDTLIIKKFSYRNDSADNHILKELILLNKYADYINNKDLRKKVATYSSLANKIISLHQDPNMNYPALGQILVPYTQSAVDVKEKLDRYKKP